MQKGDELFLLVSSYVEPGRTHHEQVRGSGIQRQVKWRRQVGRLQRSATFEVFLVFTASPCASCCVMGALASAARRVGVPGEGVRGAPAQVRREQEEEGEAGWGVTEEREGVGLRC